MTTQLNAAHTAEKALINGNPPDLLDQSDPASSELSLSLQDFVTEFGDELLNSLNQANPPVYSGSPRTNRQLVLLGLKRKLFPAQAEVVHAAAELLANHDERAAIVNGEMGTGKTTV
ncbi:DEAD/DEAH box helicase family protein, partial [Xanthomonas hortorum pv. vitians]